MLNDAQKVEVTAILDQAPRLTLEDLKVLEYDKTGCVDLRLEAFSLLRLSAAASSRLEKQVSEVVVPVLHLLQGPILSTDAARIVRSAVQAVLRRDRLSVVHYEAYVRGLRVVGWIIPPHASPEGQAWADGQVRLPRNLRQDAGDFLSQVAKMTAEDYQTVRDLKYAAFVEFDATKSLLMMPAADFRWLVDQVRATLIQAEGTMQPEFKDVSARIVGALRAVQQIVCREKMAPEHYDAVMERYRVVGIRVPPHRQGEG